MFCLQATHWLHCCSVVCTENKVLERLLVQCWVALIHVCEAAVLVIVLFQFQLFFASFCSLHFLHNNIKVSDDDDESKRQWLECSEVEKNSHNYWKNEFTFYAAVAVAVALQEVFLIAFIWWNILLTQTQRPMHRLKKNFFHD